MKLMTYKHVEGVCVYNVCMDMTTYIHIHVNALLKYVRKFALGHSQRETMKGDHELVAIGALKRGSWELI